MGHLIEIQLFLHFQQVRCVPCVGMFESTLGLGRWLARLSVLLIALVVVYVCRWRRWLYVATDEARIKQNSEIKQTAPNVVQVRSKERLIGDGYPYAKQENDSKERR